MSSWERLASRLRLIASRSDGDQALIATAVARLCDDAHLRQKAIDRLEQGC